MTKNLLTNLLYEGDDGKPFLVNDKGEKWEFPIYTVEDTLTKEDYKTLYGAKADEVEFVQKDLRKAEDEINDLRDRSFKLELEVERAESLGHRTVTIETIRSIFQWE